MSETDNQVLTDDGEAVAIGARDYDSREQDWQLVLVQRDRMALKISAALIFAACVFATVLLSADGGHRPSVWPQIHAPKTARLPPGPMRQSLPQ